MTSLSVNGIAYLHLVNHESRGAADLVAFTRRALATPDLVARLHAGCFAEYTPLHDVLDAR